MHNSRTASEGLLPTHPGPKLNPFAADLGEELPSLFSRNWSGLLIQQHKVLPRSAIDPSALQQEVTYLHQHVIIASFVGGSLDSSTTQLWLRDLGSLLFPFRVLLHKPAGKGTYFVKVDGLEAVDKAINLKLHSFPGGEASYQQWFPSFNPNHPIGLGLPFWLYLESLPLEYIPFSANIAGSLGRILFTDIPQLALDRHRYCVALDILSDWTNKIHIEDRYRGIVEIQIIYEDPRFSCRSCRTSSHPSSECPVPDPNMSPPSQNY